MYAHRTGPSTWDQTGIVHLPRKVFCAPGRQSGPEVLWTVDVGKGFGGPVIKDGKVYLLDRTDEVEDIYEVF